MSTANIGNTHNVLFPNDTGSNRSSEFVVTDQPVVLRAFNLRSGQLVRVEQGYYYGCDSVVWGPLALCCAVALSVQLTQVVLAVSGVYRVYIDDQTDFGIDDIVVTQHVAQLADPKLTTTCCSGG